MCGRIHLPEMADLFKSLDCRMWSLLLILLKSLSVRAVQDDKKSGKQFSLSW